MKLDICYSEDHLEAFLFRDGKEIVRGKIAYTEEETFEDIEKGVEELFENLVKAITEGNEPL